MTSIFGRVRDSLPLLGAVSPKKATPDESADDRMAGSPDSDLRGLKRKVKDIYDPTGDEEEGTDTSTTTPNNSKSKKSHGAIEVAGSSSSSNGKIKRRNRQSDILPEVPEPSDPRVDASANLERALAPDAARLQPDLPQSSSIHAAAPVADMGGTADLLSPRIPEKPEPRSSSPAKNAPSSKKTTTAASAAPDAGEDVKQEEEEEEEEVSEVHALLDHKMLDDDSVDLLVHWEGEPADEATWEPEQEIQDGASDLLYSYWKKRGGRTEILFKDKPEVYHVFRIIKHEKKPRGGFKLEIQWVGYPATKANTSWEPESKLRQIAPELLDEYWDSVGGRDDHLGKRGRGKKN